MKYARMWLGLAVTVGFFAVLILTGMNIMTFDDKNQSVLLLVGSLGTAYGMVMQWAFGSSAGSDRKTGLLVEMATGKKEAGFAMPWVLAGLAIVSTAMMMAACGSMGVKSPGNFLESVEAAEITADHTEAAIAGATCGKFDAGKCIEPGKWLDPDKALATFDQVATFRAALRRAQELHQSGSVGLCLGEQRGALACLQATESGLEAINEFINAKGVTDGP